MRRKASRTISDFRASCLGYATWASERPPQEAGTSTGRRSGDGRITSRVRARIAPPRVPSTAARTCSPGMAPATRTTRPSQRAIIRPPTAGLSMVSSTVSARSETVSPDGFIAVLSRAPARIAAGNRRRATPRSRREAPLTRNLRGAPLARDFRGSGRRPAAEGQARRRARAAAPARATPARCARRPATARRRAGAAAPTRRTEPPAGRGGPAAAGPRSRPRRGRRRRRPGAT